MSRRLMHLTYAEEFSLNVFLTSFPADAEFVTITDMVAQDAPEIEIHPTFGFLESDEIARRIDALAKATLKLTPDEVGY